MPIPAAPAPTSTTRVVGRRRVRAPAAPPATPATHDRRRPLDVVVERRDAVAVAVEDAQRVCCLKSSHWMTQPGQTSATPATNASTSASYVGAAQPRRAMADVQRVGEQRRVVRPDVERDRQGQGRVDAAGRRVQRELADRDGHPAGALVAEAQDPLVVGDDDEPDVLVRALAQELRDPVAVGRRDPRPAGPPDDVAELLARPPDGRRVDDRQELVEVLGQQPVEQRRVAVLERGQPDVLLERVVLAPEVLELEVDLLLDRQDPVRQQAAQPERVPFDVGEGQVLGQQPAAEERRSGERDRRPADRPRWRRTGRGVGRIPASIAVGRRAAWSQSPVTTSAPTIPYASCPGRWQMYR